MSQKANSSSAGEGIRSLRTSGVFRAVNFELYAKPVILQFIQILIKIIVTIFSEQVSDGIWCQCFCILHWLHGIHEGIMAQRKCLRSH